ncbi:BglG family transcription antiterminator [Streptococcus acidominimus]|uniref:Transcription antiterminator n=1 Tax=Streptococcus acidominimus TaxID=1326 RepID=A0A4Y9FQ70_STRAI|nr:BglG family transcription antiterminator [Streptococcus acidominimus]MBF0847243.1 BglG family transcription antiterminator [Streptococcus danieliae]MBF0818305.1 BglG family transcription antiterminator [Streptococcus acidominimus]MBF0838826.1 BglG family transcription antiterminator [Streptococcus acidominimus]MBF0839542.1 BglG family transcription antiterminator [Streptococcus acidominimus]TFU31375.1 transcription antiterminator [Streptococcus acidominimus]
MNPRQINILRDLIAAKDYVTAQELSSKYAVSTKTAYADLQMVNEELSSFGVTIEKTPRRGIRLQVKQNEKRKILALVEQCNYDVLDEDSQFHRECDLLKELILGSGTIDVLDWSVSHFISEASIRRDLERLEQRFSSYQVSLLKKSGRVSLVGQEENVRKFFRDFIIRHFDLTSLQYEEGLARFFSPDLIRNVVESVQRSSHFYHFRTSEQYRVYLVLDLLISSKRYLQGNSIVEPDVGVGVENLQQYEVYIIAGELLSQATGIAMNLITDAEVRAICYTLLSVGYETEMVQQSEFRNTVEQFIARVSELTGVDFRSDGHLFQMLVNHTQPMIYRLKSGINIKNQITENIKTRYSALYYIVWLASKSLSEKYAVEFFDAEIAFLTIYFEISVEKMTTPLTIYVICPHGLATSELVMSSLRRTISDFDHLVNMDMRELTEEKLEQADLIISSIHLEQFAVDYIQVSPIVTDEELAIIQQAYTSLTKGNRNMLSAIHDNTSFSKSVIRDLLQTNILLHQSCSSAEECIRKMVGKTSLRNQRNKRFLESVLAREKLGSTSVYTGIALPHADPAFVAESQLVIMTLDKPILWGQNMVKVVVLIAIAEKDEELYKKALIGLYSKIDRTSYIDTLHSIEDQADFIDCL